MARQTYLDAVLAGHFAGRLAPGSLREAAGGGGGRVPPVAGPALSRTRRSRTRRSRTRRSRTRCGLRSAARRPGDGRSPADTPRGVPTLKQAVRGFRDGGERLRRNSCAGCGPAAHVAMALWDDESYDVLSARHIEIGREAGALAVLPTALTTRIVACAFRRPARRRRGADRGDASAHCRDGDSCSGVRVPSSGPPGEAGEEAGPGRDRRCGQGVHGEAAEGRGSLAFADYGRAVLCNGPRPLPGGTHRGRGNRRPRRRGSHHRHARPRRASSRRRPRAMSARACRGRPGRAWRR